MAGFTGGGGSAPAASAPVVKQPTAATILSPTNDTALEQANSETAKKIKRRSLLQSPTSNSTLLGG